MDNFEIELVTSGGREVVPEFGALSVVARGGFCVVLVRVVGLFEKSLGIGPPLCQILVPVRCDW